MRNPRCHFITEIEIELLVGWFTIYQVPVSVDGSLYTSFTTDFLVLLFLLGIEAYDLAISR